MKFQNWFSKLSYQDEQVIVEYLWNQNKANNSKFSSAEWPNHKTTTTSTTTTTTITAADKHQIFSTDMKFSFFTRTVSRTKTTEKPKKSIPNIKHN